jgi:DNA-binding beta-propeller fold protein YncE
MASMRSNIVRSIFLLCAAVAHCASAQQGDYRIDADWAQVPGGDWGGSTSWVAADGKGQVVVMVRSAPYFRVFNRDGSFVRAWGEQPEFRNAHSITFDAGGNVWATDAGNHVVYKFSPEGELLQTLGRFGEAGDNSSTDLFNQPNHVAIGPDGDLYVSDGYGNARIVQFDAQGVFKRIIGGEQGAAPGQLQLPHGVAVDAAGRLLVNDSDNKRVSVFAADGSFSTSWPFASRGGLVVGDDGTVYVSDVNAGAVYLLRDGELLETIEVGVRPHGLAVDSDGAIYVSDAMARKVLKLLKITR